MSSRYRVTSVSVQGFRKRGSSHVFSVQCTWSDGVSGKVLRRYADFASFHRVMVKRYLSSGLSTEKLPDFPRYSELFPRFQHDGSDVIVPQLEILDKYCSKMVEVASERRLVEELFRYATADEEIKVKLARKKSQEEDSDSNKEEVLPEFLVIGDYEDKINRFSVDAGDIVIKVGDDPLGWCLIGRNQNKKFVQGWIPSAYLLPKQEDSMFKELYAYIRDLRIARKQKKARENPMLVKYRVVQDHQMICVNPESATLLKGSTVTVLDKDLDGWWFVSFKNVPGWFPGTLLECKRAGLSVDDDRDRVKASPSGESAETYCASHDYAASHNDEVSVVKGTMLEVLHMSASGWWTVKCGEKVGLCPAMYLMKAAYQGLLSPYGIFFHIGFNSSMMNTVPPRRTGVTSPSPRSEVSKAVPGSDRRGSGDFGTSLEVPVRPYMKGMDKCDSVEMMVLEIPHPGENSRSSSFDQGEEVSSVAMRSGAGGYASVNNLPARIAARRPPPPATTVGRGGGAQRPSAQVAPVDDRTGQSLHEAAGRVKEVSSGPLSRRGDASPPSSPAVMHIKTDLNGANSPLPLRVASETSFPLMTHQHSPIPLRFFRRKLSDSQLLTEERAQFLGSTSWGSPLLAHWHASGPPAPAASDEHVLPGAGSIPAVAHGNRDPGDGRPTHLAPRDGRRDRVPSGSPRRRSSSVLPVVEIPSLSLKDHPTLMGLLLTEAAEQEDDRIDQEQTDALSVFVLGDT